MMRRLLLPALALLSLAGCASPSGRGDLYDRPLAANPSAFIAAELAFARLAQDKGQWTAFRETAAADAVMFMPQRVLARDWLKGRADPAQAVTWQPDRKSNTSELQSLMRNSYAVFCLKKKKKTK